MTGDRPNLNATSYIESLLSQIATLKAPIRMLLFCPACGLQHVDALDPRDPEWTNPPHRSHTCRPVDGGCGHIWRPADVATEGVLRIETRGKVDSEPTSPRFLHDLKEAYRSVIRDIYARMGLPTGDNMPFAGGMARTWFDENDATIERLKERLRSAEIRDNEKMIDALTAIILLTGGVVDTSHARALAGRAVACVRFVVEQRDNLLRVEADRSKAIGFTFVQPEDQPPAIEGQPKLFGEEG